MTIEELRKQNLHQAVARFDFTDPKAMDEKLALVRVISGKETVDGEVRGSRLLRIELGGPRSAEDYYWRDCGVPTLSDRIWWEDWPGVKDGDPVTRGHLKQLGF